MKGERVERQGQVAVQTIDVARYSPPIAREEVSASSRIMRMPSLRAPLEVLFLVCCVVLTGFVLVPEIFGNGKTKDYPLWYWAGQQVLQGQPLYPTDDHAFEFIYPPLTAVLLAIPSWFGKTPLYLFLSLINVFAWWTTLLYSNAMTGAPRAPGMWLFALPGFVTITFVFDMFDLGQPNLVLLALMLLGFWSMQHRRPWSAGSMFALASAIKVFPVAVSAYLVWRGKWRTLASMVLFLGIFLMVVPAPVRGFEDNIAELKRWYGGMVGSASEKGFGQRNEQNWSWVNQSVIAMTHRLTRPINYNQDDPSRPVRTMNVVDISFNAANILVVALLLLTGLGYVAAMPPASRRTDASDAEEIALFFCLMTLACPLARQYYFIALLFPMTVLMHRCAHDPEVKVRIGTWLALGAAGLFMLLSLPVFPRDLQAWGNNLVATVIISLALAWHLRHPAPSRTVSSAANVLSLDDERKK